MVVAAGFDALLQGHRWRWVDGKPVVARLFCVAEGSADGEGGDS